MTEFERRRGALLRVADLCSWKLYFWTFAVIGVTIMLTTLTIDLLLRSCLEEHEYAHVDMAVRAHFGEHFPVLFGN